MKEQVLALLKARHISLEALATLLWEIQSPYIPGLTLACCQETLEKVLEKREVQHHVLTGLALDVAAEKSLLEDAINDIVAVDYPMYGVDETIGLAIATIYGTIALTNFGYLDKEKPGYISQLNDDKSQVNTFADDIASALVAAGAARLAHQYQG